VELDLALPPAELALALVDVPSESGHEGALADLMAQALTRQAPHLELLRDGDTLVARTHLGRPERVILAGHLDTVPAAGNVPGRLAAGTLWGRGSVDMKGGLAVMAGLARRLTAPRRDITYVFYDHEEVAAELSGLGRTVAHHPDWIGGGLAVLGEPTAGAIEGGCNGTVRVELTAEGVAAHSARSWLGVNAIHQAAPILDRLAAFEAETVRVDGLDYREGLNAVGIEGGIAGNVVPDRCVVTVNYRFAPDKSADDAVARLREWFGGFGFRVTDRADGARPGLDAAPAQDLARAVADAGGPAPRAKLGWTDVARFSALGIPAVNFGPGDPSLAHADQESCPAAEIDRAARVLERWLA
jgi:succinyl-diaminopimelate desuccinylase